MHEIEINRELYMAKVNYVADKAAETHKKIKALRNTKMSNQARREAIKAEQDKWWDGVRPLITIYTDNVTKEGICY